MTLFHLKTDGHTNPNLFIASSSSSSSSSSFVSAASMMNTVIFRRLRVVRASLLNSNLYCKLSVIHPFYFRNAFSTEPHSQTFFSQFASTKLDLSEADITRILKLQPRSSNLEILHKVEHTIHLLKKHGCTEAQIANMLRLRPQLVGIAENILEPKLQLLEDFGFVDQNLVKLLTISSSLLARSLENSLLPKMEFLKNVFQSQDSLVKALLRAPRLLGYSLESILKPSLSFWEGWGFSGTELVSFLQVYPEVLTRTSLLPAQVDLINKIGPDKDSKPYKYIVSTVAVSRMETLEAKIENFKLCGFSPEETWQVLRAIPLVIKLSKKNVSEKMNFLVNNMELPVHYVVKHPCLLQTSLEEAMRPRFLVWQKIKSTNAAKLPLLTVLRMPETRFVSNIIKTHPESEMLWTIYKNAISNASNAKRAQQNELLYGKNES